MEMLVSIAEILAAKSPSDFEILHNVFCISSIDKVILMDFDEDKEVVDFWRSNVDKIFSWLRLLRYVKKEEDRKFTFLNFLLAKGITLVSLDYYQRLAIFEKIKDLLKKYYSNNVLNRIDVI